MGVFDPILKYTATFSGDISAGAKVRSGILFEAAPDEVFEVFRIEVKPPVNPDTGAIYKLKEIGLEINGEAYPYIHANAVMFPPERPTVAAQPIDLGTPVLWSRLLGTQPNAIDAAIPRLKEGDRLAVYAVAEDAIPSGVDFEVSVLGARARGADVIAKEAGRTFVADFQLDADRYTKGAIPITAETFNQLPGGLAQSVPKIFPWITYARNAEATTANKWYSFSYPDRTVTEEWMTLKFNLPLKPKAYAIFRLGVIPHANAKALRFFVEGRETQPEFPIYELPGQNFFPPAMFYDTAVNADLKWAGPRKLFPTVVFHGVKGGVEIVDNGTSIPANGIELHVYGKIFILTG